MPDRKAAKQFRQISRLIQTSSSVLTQPYTDAGLAQVAGVRTRPVRGVYDADQLTKGEIATIEALRNLTVSEKATLIGISSFYGAMLKQVNRQVKEDSQLTLERVRRQSSFVRRGRGAKSTVRVTYRRSATVGVDRFPLELEYRDPFIGKTFFPPVWVDISGKNVDVVDPIHIGASINFNRYAIRSFTVFGKKLSTPGLGYEPLGIKPKSSGAFPKDYRAFVRRGYPNREEPDTLDGSKGRFNLYERILRRKQPSSVINRTVLNAMNRYFTAQQSARYKLIIDEGKKAER